MTADIRLADLGVSEETSSSLSSEHTARAAAAVNSSRSFKDGDPLPALWHWTHFLPTAATSSLGADGHPPLAADISAAYPRRMWASGSLDATGQLVLGEPATRRTSLRKARETDGRSGRLLIVELEHRYSQFDVDQLSELQTLVYRAAGAPEPLPTSSSSLSDSSDAAWSERHRPDPIMLFRFSAVTFNSHRIHYDEPYATGIEKYPALVVHGPLVALLVGEAIRRWTSRELASFEFKANSALFAGQELTITGSSTNDVASAKVLRCDGVEAMSATATLGDVTPSISND